jgi:hypothetical protein
MKLDLSEREVNLSHRLTNALPTRLSRLGDRPRLAARCWLACSARPRCLPCERGTRTFHFGGGGYGLLMAVFGVGALPGALLAASGSGPPRGRSVVALALVTPRSCWQRRARHTRHWRSPEWQRPAASPSGSSLGLTPWFSSSPTRLCAGDLWACGQWRCRGAIRSLVPSSAGSPKAQAHERNSACPDLC